MIGLLVYTFILICISSFYCWYATDTPSEGRLVPKNALTISEANLLIISKDQAVRAYLEIAQKQAEVYRFTNGGSYTGLCEPSEVLNSLSNNTFIYIKNVGAQELFCANDATTYFIEVFLLEQKKFVCISPKGMSSLYDSSNKELASCNI